MPDATREAAMAALLELVGAAYEWKLGPLRRLKLWSDVPSVSRPACFVFEGGEDVYTWPSGSVPTRIVDARLFIYFNSKDPSVVGSAVLNTILDALDSAFRPRGADEQLGRNTLKGTVHNCRMAGKVLKDPGDLDGDGLIIVPVKMVLP